MKVRNVSCTYKDDLTSLSHTDLNYPDKCSENLEEFSFKFPIQSYLSSNKIN